MRHMLANIDDVKNVNLNIISKQKMEQTIYSNEFLAQTGNPYFKIEAREGERFLRIAWIGFINEERAKTGILEELAAIQKTNRNLLLVDNREQSGPFPKAIDAWVAEEIAPKILSLGGARFAQVLSQNVFTEFSAKNMENNQEINDKQAIHIANFPTEEAAINWLLS